jgi:hypothetical protein
MVPTGNRTARRGVQLGMRRARAALPAVLLVLASAACGHDAKVATGASTTVPARPADVVLSITSGGGFVPFGADFANVPLKVQRDGTVYTGGAIPAIYPGPALTPVSTGKLAGAQVQQLLDEARADQLGEDHLDVGQPPVSDMPSTTITVELDGTLHTHSIYALGYGIDDPQQGLSNLTPAQGSLRKALSNFVTHASDLVSQAADQAYAPVAYQVLATRIDPASEAPPEVTPNQLTWPAPDLPLVAGAACIDIDAAHAPALTEALTTASQITVWHDGGATWHLSVRATLPGDAACADRKG